MSEQIESVEVLRSEVAPVVQQAGAIVVRSPEQYQGASDFLKAVKAAQKKVVDFFAPMKAKAHEAHKAITTTESNTLKPLSDAEATIKRKMIEYATEQERIRREQERKLQAAADLKARIEREALEKKAASMKTPEKQQEYREAAAAVVAPVVQVAAVTPEIKGQAITKRWKATITDPKEAVMALLAYPDWSAYIEINQGQLDKFASRTNGSVSMKGVTFAEVAGLSSTSR